jgi:hypothetical protein
MKKKSQSQKEETVAMRIQPKVIEHDKFDLEDAVRTLARAEEIKQDDKLMGKIKPMLKKKVMSIESLQKLYNDKYNQPLLSEEEDDKAEGEMDD